MRLVLYYTRSCLSVCFSYASAVLDSVVVVVAVEFVFAFILLFLSVSLIPICIQRVKEE
jgi:hypothetical protein